LTWKPTAKAMVTGRKAYCHRERLSEETQKWEATV